MCVSVCCDVLCGKMLYYPFFLVAIQCKGASSKSDRDRENIYTRYPNKYQNRLWQTSTIVAHIQYIHIVRAYINNGSMRQQAALIAALTMTAAMLLFDGGGGVTNTNNNNNNI